MRVAPVIRSKHLVIEKYVLDGLDKPKSSSTGYDEFYRRQGDSDSVGVNDQKYLNEAKNFNLRPILNESDLGRLRTREYNRQRK